MDVQSSVWVDIFDVSLVAYVGLAYLACAMHLVCGFHQEWLLMGRGYCREDQSGGSLYSSLMVVFAEAHVSVGSCSVTGASLAPMPIVEPQGTLQCWW